ncbi:AAA family ATPase [Streptomyces sp. NPDC057239]|uniref:AAA family ATPase n=1 Tax=Streptomyces sp. NPDC057239 TaxID=3346061 RepID=UPI003633B09B
MSGDTHSGDRIDFRNGTFRGEAIGKKVEHHHHYGPMPHVEDALPPVAAEFTGRAEELDALLAALAPGPGGHTPVPVTAVAGLGGVGKTALAVRAAHTARERGWFPGGALFVDCHGYDETPAGAERLVEALLRALGVAAAHVPTTLDERAGLYRSVLAERARTSGAVLIVVDNASHPGQVRPLLPGHGAHRVLVTSRDTMPQLGAHLLRLDILRPEVARDVLGVALRTAAPADPRVLDAPEATGNLCALCGYLPLALQIAAALLIADPGKPVTELVAELADSATVIDHLDDGERGVRAAFDLSYRRLGPGPSRLFRLLALAPGPETSDEAITVLYGADALPRPELNVLVRAHLVGPGSVRGYWTMHDLVRAYALDRVAREESLRAEGTRARARLLAHYQRRSEAADRHVQSRPAPAPSPRVQRPAPAPGDRRLGDVAVVQARVVTDRRRRAPLRGSRLPGALIHQGPQPATGIRRRTAMDDRGDSDSPLLRTRLLGCPTGVSAPGRTGGPGCGLFQDRVVDAAGVTTSVQTLGVQGAERCTGAGPGGQVRVGEMQARSPHLGSEKSKPLSTVPKVRTGSANRPFQSVSFCRDTDSGTSRSLNVRSAHGVGADADHSLNV